MGQLKLSNMHVFRVPKGEIIAMSSLYLFQNINLQIESSVTPKQTKLKKKNST